MESEITQRISRGVRGLLRAPRAVLHDDSDSAAIRPCCLAKHPAASTRDSISSPASSNAAENFFCRIAHLASRSRTPGAWAGRREKNETMRQAMQREVREEAGIGFSESDFHFESTLYARYPNDDFQYLTFKTRLPEKVTATINTSEHQAYVWATPQQALALPLIPHLDESIRIHYATRGDSPRTILFGNTLHAGAPPPRACL